MYYIIKTIGEKLSIRVQNHFESYLLHCIKVSSPSSSISSNTFYVNCKSNAKYITNTLYFAVYCILINEKIFAVANPNVNKDNEHCISEKYCK